MKSKDSLSYVITTGAVAINFIDLNTALTTLILLATLIFWVQKNWGQFKRNKNDK